MVRDVRAYRVDRDLYALETVLTSFISEGAPLLCEVHLIQAEFPLK